MIPFTFIGNSTGMTVFATIERISDGYYWSTATGAFANAPTDANKKISLTEGTGMEKRCYKSTLTDADLGNAGKCRVLFHDDNDSDDCTIGGETYDIFGAAQGVDVVGVNGAVATLASGVNATQISGSSEAADRFERAALAITTFTVGSASTTTSIVTSAMSPAAAVADQFKGQIVCFDKDTTTANLRGQKTEITASTSGGVLTCSALTTAPVSGDTGVIQ